MQGFAPGVSGYHPHPPPPLVVVVVVTVAVFACISVHDLTLFPSPCTFLPPCLQCNWSSRPHSSVGVGRAYCMQPLLALVCVCVVVYVLCILSSTHARATSKTKWRATYVRMFLRHCARAQLHGYMAISLCPLLLWLSVRLLFPCCPSFVIAVPLSVISPVQ